MTTTAMPLTTTATEWEWESEWEPGMAPAPQPRAGMRLSAAAFMELPDTDDRRRMELDDGVLYIMPKPKLNHQFAMGELFLPLALYRNRQDEATIQVYQDIILAPLPERPRLRLAPDLVVLRRGNPAQVTNSMVTGAPDIAVEILSSDRNRDLVRKRRIYAEAGIPEYWIWDWQRDTVTVLTLPVDGEYTAQAVLSYGDTLTTPLLPGLSIPLSDILQHRDRPTLDE